MASCYIYIGIPNSGKTTIAYQEHGEDAVIIDSDATRAKLFNGDATRQDQNSLVFQRMYDEVCQCLERGISVAYVATNISCKRRMNLLRNLRRRFPDVTYEAVVVNTPINVCHERNSRRERQVPTYVIDRMARQFDPPTLNEGFDSIRVVDNYIDNSLMQLGSDYGIYRHMYEEQVRSFGSQGNRHHSLTLLDHCQKCGDLAKADGAPEDLVTAAYIHDYGKLLTATRWEKDNYAELHYPNHSQIGSYMALSMGYSLHVAQLVRFHMVPYGGETEQKVWRARMGEELWAEVQQLHQYDQRAH